MWKVLSKRGWSHCLKTFELAPAESYMDVYVWREVTICFSFHNSLCWKLLYRYCKWQKLCKWVRIQTKCSDAAFLWKFQFATPWQELFCCQQQGNLINCLHVGGKRPKQFRQFRSPHEELFSFLVQKRIVWLVRDTRLTFILLFRRSSLCNVLFNFLYRFIPFLFFSLVPLKKLKAKTCMKTFGFENIGTFWKISHDFSKLRKKMWHNSLSFSLSSFMPSTPSIRGWKNLLSFSAGACIAVIALLFPLNCI